MVHSRSISFASSNWNGMIDGQAGSCQLEGKLLPVMVLEV